MICGCGAEIVVSAIEIADLETVECPECGTDNYVDEEMVVNINEGPDELDFT